METAISRRNIETMLIQKCWKDPLFRQQVISDPKGVFEKHIGQRLPDELTIVIHPEDANTLHFSIPPAPFNLSELSDEELERVAGGTDIVISAAVVAGAVASLAVTGGVVAGAITLKSGGW